MTNVIAKYSTQGEKFEIIVDLDLAWDYKLGKRISLDNVLVYDVVYKDVNKGEKATSSSLQKIFKTTDIYKIADIIIKKGELPITAERRNKLIEENKRRIIDIISRNCIDVRTNAPIPPSRVESAMSEVKVKIDPFKDVNIQAAEIIKQLKRIIPIKISKAVITIKIPTEFAAKVYNQVIVKMANVLNSNWKEDGSWEGEVEIPAGIQQNFIQKINEISRFKAIIKGVKII